MIHCNGNVEFQAALNKEEAIWWQNRITEFGGKSEIIARNPEKVNSVKEATTYLKYRGKHCFREALKGSEVAMSVYHAYRMFHNCPEDPGSQAFLEIAVNDYIQSKKFTLELKNPSMK